MDRRKEAFPVNPIFGAVPKNHPAAATFRDVPRLGAGALLLAFLPAIAVASLVIPAVVWCCLHLTYVIPPDLYPLIMGGLFAWAAMLGGGVYLGLVSLRRRLQALDQGRLGSPSPRETLVGISYAEGVWSLHDDVAWDRGYLSASSEGLHFRGHVSRFDLPAHAIRSVRLETSRMAQHRTVPRLFIDWTSPDGEENTLSLDTRPFLPNQSTVKEVERLRGEIQDALSQPSGHPLSPIWPPAVRLNRLDLRGSQIRLTTRDFLSVITLGLAFGIVILIAITAIIAVLPIEQSQRETLQRIFGFIAPQIPGFCGLFFWGRRFQKKLKALPEPDQPVHDLLPPARAMEEVPAEDLKLRA